MQLLDLLSSYNIFNSFIIACCSRAKQGGLEAKTEQYLDFSRLEYQHTGFPLWNLYIVMLTEGIKQTGELLWYELKIVDVSCMISSSIYVHLLTQKREAKQ